MEAGTDPTGVGQGKGEPCGRGSGGWALGVRRVGLGGCGRALEDPWTAASGGKFRARARR